MVSSSFLLSFVLIYQGLRLLGRVADGTANLSPPWRRCCCHQSRHHSRPHEHESFCMAFNADKHPCFVWRTYIHTLDWRISEASNTDLRSFWAITPVFLPHKSTTSVMQNVERKPMPLFKRSQNTKTQFLHGREGRKLIFGADQLQNKPWFLCEKSSKHLAFRLWLSSPDKPYVWPHNHKPLKRWRKGTYLFWKWRRRSVFQLQTSFSAQNISSCFPWTWSLSCENCKLWEVTKIPLDMWTWRS